MGDLSLRIILRGQDGGIGGVIRRVRSNLRAMEVEDAGRHRRVMARLNGVAAGYRRIGRAAMSAVTAGAGVAGAIFGAGLVGITRTAIEFERYEAVLIGLEGSQAKAKASMAWVMEFAKTTPYEIGQVMEAFVRLRAYGIDPTDGTMRALGDTASTMGKDIMSAVEMLADAQSGEFERLKEFGIRASQVGDRVTFSWVENGKTMTRSSQKTGAEITRTLLGIMGPKNAGAMERQSRTLGGIWSSLMDQITLFKVMISEAGLADFMRDELNALMGNLDTPEGQAKAQALAKEISGALVEGLREIRAGLAGVDWKEFIKGLVAIVTFIPKVISFFGGLQGVITALGALGIGKIGLDLGVLGATLAGIAGIAAGPIIAVIAVITAIALAAWLIYRNWGRVKSFFSDLWKSVRIIFDMYVKWSVRRLLDFGPFQLIRHWSTIVSFFSGMWTRIQGAFKTGVDAVWNILPAWFRAVLRGASFVIRAVSGVGPAPGAPPAGSPPRSPPPGGSAARPNVGPAAMSRLNGQIDVRTFHDGRVPEVFARSSTPGFTLAPVGGVGTRGDR